MNVRSLYNITETDLLTESNSLWVINSEERTITPPTNFKTFGVESDENSNRVYFKCKRYVGDNLDLASLNIRINYKNANGDKDQYIVTDTVVDGDNVYFSWLLSRKCTCYKGDVVFIVCAVKTSSDGVIVNEWNTGLAIGTVLAGLEVENPEIPADTIDLVSQLVDITKQAKTDALAEIETAKTEAVGTITNTPNTLYANAIKGRASGEVVTVNDLSEVPHIVKAKVHGKNLFNIDADLNKYLTKNADGTYTITRLDNRFSNYIDLKIPANTHITISGKGISESGFRAVTLMFDFVDKSTAYVNMTAQANTFKRIYAKDIKSARIYLLPDAVEGDYKTFEGIQIEIGENATEYEPYISPDTITLSVYGDNEENPVTYTPNTDGTVDVNSISPTMTLLTDTEGVTIHCEYVKDTNKVITELVDRITALESGV